MTSKANTNNPKHIIFLSGALWSHVIVNVQVALRIATASPTTYISFIATGDTPDMSKMINMFNAGATTRLRQTLDSFTGVHAAVRDRVQVLECAPSKGTDPGAKYTQPEDISPPVMILDGFEWAWLDLCGPELGAGLGSKWKIKPTMWFFEGNTMDSKSAIRELAKTHGTPVLPGFLVYGMGSTTLLRLFATEDRFGGVGGVGGAKRRYLKLKEEGMEDSVALSKALQNDEGRLMQFEDMPPMYDYEFRPQSMSTKWPPGFIEMQEKAADPEIFVNGMIDYGCGEFEPWATKELTTYLEAHGKKHFPIGYGLTREMFESQNPSKRREEGSLNGEENKVFEWLDKMQKEHGDHSVAYICFGSIVWPTERPEIIETIVQGLLEAKPPIPFLCSVSSIQKPVPVPDSVKEKAAKSGLGMFVDWVPQMSVLQHPATRFFINHCGAGSMIESLYAAIPIVAVPFVNDEAFVARQLVEHKAAIQLHQLNSGMKGKPLGIGGTVTEDPKDMLKEAKEAFATLADPIKYEEYRGNVRKLSKLLERSVESGESAKALKELMKTYL